MSKKLKPCPFCGSEDVVVNSIGADTPEITEEYYVECVNCGSQTKLFDTQEVTTTAWNTRDISFLHPILEEIIIEARNKSLLSCKEIIKEILIDTLKQCVESVDAYEIKKV